MKLTICLDVGGSFAKGTVFDEKSNELVGGINYYPAKSEESGSIIIDNFEHIILDLYMQLVSESKIIESIMMAFPGPFDYPNGISLITGLGKYEALYKVNIKELLLEKIMNNTNMHITQQVSIQFFNDATSFAFGEYAHSQSIITKGAYFTLGTGCGSTFIEAGKSVKGQFGIPDSGMIYNELFKNSIIDDYLSARGFSKIIQDDYGDNLTPVEIYHLAISGNQQAIRVFDLFGRNIGEALAPYIKQFQPDEIVFGGQISKGFQYMEYAIRKVFDQMASDYELRVSEDTSYSAIQGLDYLKNQQGEDIFVK